jgi:transcriptional regulator with XRE-family HTH domain
MKGNRKKRTKLGKWLDRNGIEQQELEEAANVSRNTISRLCNNSQHTPSFTVVQKIMRAIKRVDPHVKISDFWDIDM